MPSEVTSRRSSARDHVVATALDVARGGGSVSLDSVARAAGLTKPGLMYHFATKEALMVAVVDEVMDRVERELVRNLPAGRADGADGSVEDRLLAYVEWACTGDFDAGDLVMFVDPRLREPLTARWAERIEPWLAVPPSVPAERRARLLTARLAADGVWFGLASGGLPLARRDRAAVRRFARALVEGAP